MSSLMTIAAVATSVFLCLLIGQCATRPLSNFEDGIVLCYNKSEADKAKVELQNHVYEWLKISNVKNITDCERPKLNDLDTMFLNSYCPEVMNASAIDMKQVPPVVSHAKCICEGENFVKRLHNKLPKGSRCVQRSRLEPVWRQSKELENTNNSLCAKGHGDPYLYRLGTIEVPFACELQLQLK